jgi:hypothetical protein
MMTRALVAVTTFGVAFAIAGCDRTTAGTVAMTTEAGSSTDVATPSTDGSTPSPVLTPSPTPSAQAPQPGDALSVTCSEYVQLDVASQTALIEEILKDKTSVISPADEELAKTLADAVCTFLPESAVSEILIGETPP